MKHQLILFYGSSPGSGKSTLSSRLNLQLKEQDVSVRWIYEDDVLSLDCFTPVVECVQNGGGKELLNACLEATDRMVAVFAETDITIIADSILPYYDWLLAANIDDASIAEFGDQLWTLLQPMNPLIVYLKADVETALKRAVAYRGQAWLERSLSYRNTWGANQAQPLRDLADVIAYDERMDRAKQQFLSEWRGEILWLDSVSMSLDACMTTMLTYMEFEPGIPKSIVAKNTVHVDYLDGYMGQYKSCDDDPPREQQTTRVLVKDGDLWVDLYWPNGCRLVAIGEQAFQLQDTSHWVEFVEPKTADAKWLRYHYRGEVYTYEFQST